MQLPCPRSRQYIYVATEISDAVFEYNTETLGNNSKRMVLESLDYLSINTSEAVLADIGEVIPKNLYFCRKNVTFTGSTYPTRHFMSFEGKLH